ncbi:MAG: PIG-L family deacetylase [Longimicrobiales bacterium]|nr:PIG-L family deacetylase [Longimicrobiales bacterium]
MSRGLRLTCVLAHPDDETLGTGGILARYADEGVETSVITATRGDAGRYRTPDTAHPGRQALGRIREEELRAAAGVLGVRDVSVLGYPDGELDRVNVAEAVARIAGHLRRLGPQVVVTFDPFGAYGHPDHIAVSQLATAACMEAAPHTVSKLYYMAWDRDLAEAYQAAFKRLTSTVDGVVREAAPWPEWSITTRIDAADHWRRVWKAVGCHESQMAVYGPLEELDEQVHRVLWGHQSFYRAFSTVNGGRERESDLFEGLR